jgi:hypothetical protein
MLVTRARDVLGSNLGRDTEYRDSPNLSRRMPEQYLESVNDLLFPHPFHFIIQRHSVIRYYIT